MTIFFCIAGGILSSACQHAGDHSIPYGLRHSTHPSETVKRFLAAVQVVVQ